MCEWHGGYDGERADAYRAIHRTARREHGCFECGGKIGRGERYRYVSGIWEGEASSYKFCAACDATAAAFLKAHPGASRMYGGLSEDLEHCIEEETTYDDDDNEVVTDAGKRWQAELDAMAVRRSLAGAKEAT